MSYPVMPKEEITENQQLQKIVLELAVLLEVRSLFNDSIEIDWQGLPPTTDQLVDTKFITAPFYKLVYSV